MCAVADQQHRTVGCDAIEEVTVREPALGERLVIETECGQGSARREPPAASRNMSATASKSVASFSESRRRAAARPTGWRWASRRPGTMVVPGKRSSGRSALRRSPDLPHLDDAMTRHEDRIAAHTGVVTDRVGNDEAAKHTAKGRWRRSEPCTCRALCNGQGRSPTATFRNNGRSPWAMVGRLRRPPAMGNNATKVHARLLPIAHCPLLPLRDERPPAPRTQRACHHLVQRRSNSRCRRRERTVVGGTIEPAHRATRFADQQEAGGHVPR